MPWPIIVDDLADLVLGRCCLGCQEPGRALCRDCLATLRGRPVTVPLPAPMPLTLAATAYHGLVRGALLAYKEQGNRGLTPALGALIADAVLAHRPGPGGYVLIPVPTHRHAARGFDALGALTTAAARVVRDRGFRVRIERPIRAGRAYRPLKGFSRQERFRRIEGAFAGSASAARRVAAEARVLIVDDVVTSGATVAEAARTLRTVGVHPDGVAALAATIRDTRARIRAPAPPTPPC